MAIAKSLARRNAEINNGTNSGIMFFAFLIKMLLPIQDVIKDISLGFQGLIIIFVLCLKKIHLYFIKNNQP